MGLKLGGRMNDRFGARCRKPRWFCKLGHQKWRWTPLLLWRGLRWSSLSFPSSLDFMKISNSAPSSSFYSHPCTCWSVSSEAQHPWNHSCRLGGIPPGQNHALLILFPRFGEIKAFCAGFNFYFLDSKYCLSRVWAINLNSFLQFR